MNDACASLPNQRRRSTDFRKTPEYAIKVLGTAIVLITMVLWVF